MSPKAAAAKEILLAHCLKGFGTTIPANLRAWFVPGRIEFLGKHTDYAGGRSLVCAVERGICLVASPRLDALLRISDASDGSTAEFRVDPELQPVMGHWSNYPMTVARRVARNFPGPLCGADIVFSSDLPPAAGMSSSSMLIVAFFAVLSALNHLEFRPEYQSHIRCSEDLAGYLGCHENGQSFGALAGDHGVGTFGGSEDHTAILCGRPRHLSCYSYCPVRFERHTPIPEGYVFAIGVSGVVAEKTAAARERYNRASRATALILEFWRQTTGRADGSLAAALASSPEAPRKILVCLESGHYEHFTSRELIDRLQQFHTESETIIPKVADLLERREVEAIGTWVDLSQKNAENWLKNQVPETIHLVRQARKEGAPAASAFGAGFGGSVWALVHEESALDFLCRWEIDYRKSYPQHEQARFFLTHAGPPMTEIALPY